MIEDRINFIEWLINRLIYRHNYAKDDSIISSLISIKHTLELPHQVNIEDNDLDQIICKYYIDFHLDKCDDINIGYTDKDRALIRQTIKNITNDILGTINKGTSCYYN